MKPVTITRFLTICLFLLGIAGITQAQEAKKDKKAEKAAAIKAMVEDRKYTFHAQNAMPMQGRTFNLTSDYTIKMSNDTLQADLPYFGRAYSAPMDPTKGGIQFTSKDFQYEQKDIKGGWQILIKPKDAGDVRQFNLSIFTSGTASLQVTNTNRQPISFNGYVDDRR